MASRVLRVQFDRLLEQATGFGIVIFPLPIQLLQTAQDIVVRDKALRRLALGELGASHLHPPDYGCHDGPHDLVLDSENVFQIPVIPLSPEVRTIH